MSSGFINHINRFIRQKTVRNITVGKFDCHLNCFIRVLHPVMFFISRTQTVKDLNGVFHSGRFHNHRLETTFQSRIFFDPFAVFIQCRCPDALQLSARQCGFDDIGSIHRPFRTACADDRMQFINKKYHISGVPDFINDSFDPFFKLPAVFCTGNHQRQIQSINFFILQDPGDISGCDFLCNTFNNGGFSDTGLTDQDRIIFRASAKDLQHTVDLILPSDHRIKPAF